MKPVNERWVNFHQRTAMRDVVIGIAVTITATLSFMWFDLFESLFELTRDHENYNLDDLIVGLIPLSFVTAWLLYRRWTESNRLYRQLKPTVAGLKSVHETLRKSEASLANAQRIARIGNWEWNIETDEVRRSAEMFRILGMAPQELGTSHDAFLERIHPDDAEAVAGVIEAIVEAGEPFSLSFRVVLPDGTVRILQEQGEVTLDDAGRPLLVAGTTQDITERKRAEEALRESEHALQDRVTDLEDAHRKLERQGADLARIAEDLRRARDLAEAANRAKSEFLANMSHELRTPLNAVIGFSEVMKQGILGPLGNPKYLEYSEDIHDAGNHLLDLINDILDLSKVESGKDELHEEVLEIGGLLDSVRKLVSGRAERASVALEFDVARGLPALRADERKLKQIFVNLMSNAINFTDAGGRVTFRAWYSGDGGLVLQVSDTGIGIASDDIPIALAPFRQVEDALARKCQGTGLGLPLAKSLVEMHGGSLDLQSQPGVGTTVTVRFPASRVVAAAAKRKRAS